MEALIAVSKNAQLHITWALSVFAGTIATIISTSFIAPKEKKIKLSYLLFLPGWILLGTSIYFGNKVERGYLAALHLAESSGRYEVAVRMNNSYKLQQNLLMFGMGIFGVWLIVYLFWWVFKRN